MSSWQQVLEVTQTRERLLQACGHGPALGLTQKRELLLQACGHSPALVCVQSPLPGFHEAVRLRFSEDPV